MRNCAIWCTFRRGADFRAGAAHQSLHTRPPESARITPQNHKSARGVPTIRLQGKVALISGAAKGMGAVEARMFAAEGAAVVLADLLDERGQAVAEEIIESGGQGRPTSTST